MLESVWHTPNQDAKYHRYVSLEDDITPVKKFPRLRMMYSYREIVLHGESSDIYALWRSDSILIEHLSTMESPTVCRKSSPPNTGLCGKKVERVSALYKQLPEVRDILL
jgi:hypothetical protein